MLSIGRISLMVAGACFLLATGVSCSSSSGLNPVQGKVTLKGKPLSGAVVTFHPEGADTVSNFPIGQTTDDGSFTIATGDQTGAPAGNYTVTIVSMVAPKAPAGKKIMTGELEPVDQLRGAYANPSTSRLKVTVKEGPNELDPFNL